MNPVLLKTDRLLADIGRTLFRLPVGGPIDCSPIRCWRDVPSHIKFVPMVYMTACDKPGLDDGLGMCAEHYAKWTEEVPT